MENDSQPPALEPAMTAAGFRGVLLFAALVIGSVVMTAAPLTKLERQRLVAHLEMTENWLADEVWGLSGEQVRFRPAPGAWNILEVLDHLIVAGPIYWQDLEKALKAPPSDKGRPDKDADVLWYGIDRSQRQQAVPAEKPKGDLRDLKVGLEAFHKLQARMLAYAKTTDDDLRGHIVERERCDAYQWLLLISTHVQRHILQIMEIKADRKFPHPR
ncbi:MAG: DinB family protein [Acidobacteriales bacterium]|nr:DinB family protein [Terriglobales bacterium]